jgi:parallel beta helix pectate lyase-like protein/uncharacterized protein DUF11
MRRALSGLAVAVVAGGLMAGGLAGPAAAADGATVYAAPAGAGSDCSAAAPCSLDSAVGQANAASGDTVVLADGSYSGVALRLQASMSLTAAPGTHPVLHGDGTDAVVEAAAGTVSVSGLTVMGGAIGIGAATTAGPLTVTGSTMSGNSSYGLEAETSTTVAGSTIAANGVTGLTVGPVDGPAISVTNTTITGNNTGIELSKGSASVTLTGVTISGNSQLGLEEEGTGPSGDSVRLGSSLITGNGTGCFFDRTPADAGSNVESDDSCGLGSTSRVGVGDAAIGLGPLAANGSAGPQTQAIGPSSAAYQLVPAGSALCPAADERGVPRPGSGTTGCDAGAYEYHAPLALTQAAPTSGTVTAGTAFAAQLAVTGATGAVTYTTASPAGPVTVSPSGAITAPASVPAGVYQLAGTVTDPAGDTGSWSFTLAVTSPGPARADLSLTLAAPAQVHPGSQATVTITVRNTGPSAAARTGTALLIPRGWTVVSPGGGTLIGRPLLTFTAASVPPKGSVTYTVILTAPAAKGLALLPAATASVTADPSYRNNVTLALTQVR